MLAPDAPLLQVKVLFPIPPAATTEIAPFVKDAHEIGVIVPEIEIPEMLLTVKLIDAVQPLASVTVAV